MILRWVFGASFVLSVAAQALSSDTIILKCTGVPLEDIYQIQVRSSNGYQYLVLNQRDGQIEMQLPTTGPCTSVPNKIALPPWQGMVRTLELRTDGWVIQACGPNNCEVTPVNCH